MEEPGERRYRVNMMNDRYILDITQTHSDVIEPGRDAAGTAAIQRHISSAAGTLLVNTTYTCPSIRSDLVTAPGRGPRALG